MKVTLSDIAKRIGVSPSTVQRALNNVAGVGDSRREQIRQLAADMGYSRNLTASSLRMGSRTVALVLPEAVQNNRFYARYLWEGALRGIKRHAEISVNALEFPYVRTPENHAAKLREAFEAHGELLDGVLTMGSPLPAAVEVFARLRERGIPVVFVGTDGEPGDRLCCVRTYDEMAGRMAADLLINFAAPQKHSKVILTGDFAIADQFYNAQGFEKHILENESPLEILKLSNDPDLDVVTKGVREVLDSGLDICAVYATSARNTAPMCRAVSESGQQGRVRTIGSDIFPESVALTRNGQLNAIIHKRPGMQAFQAMQTLLDILARESPPPEDVVLVDSVIVMKSNLERFL